MRHQRPFVCWHRLLMSCVLTGGALVPGGVRAEIGSDLAGITPADALIYVGWRGLPAEEATGSEEAAPGSWLRALEVLAQAQSGQEAGEALARLAKLCQVLERRPAGLALLDFGMGANGPEVQAALVVRAGPQTRQIEELVEGLLTAIGLKGGERIEVEGVSLKSALLPGAPFTVCWGTHKEHFLMSLGPQAAGALLRGINAAGPGLAGNPEMQLCREAVAGKNDKPLLCVFSNVPGLVRKGKALAEAMTGGLPPVVGALLEETGINGIRSKYLQVSLQQGVLRLAAYAHAPRPRKGLLYLWEQKSLAEADYHFVPADAYFMQAGNWDLSATYRHLHETLGRIDPGLPVTVNNLMEMAKGLLGIHPVDDFLNCFGDTWVLYDAPSRGGLFFTGSVLVVEIKDAERLRAGCRTLVQTLAAMPALESKFKLQLRQGTCGERQVSSLVFAGAPVPVAPSWAEVEGRGVFGLFPQTVAAALTQLDPQTRQSTLVGSPEFKRLRQSLPAGALSTSYVDNAAYLRFAYPLMLLWNCGQQAILGGFGFEPDVAAMPTLTEQVRSTTPAIGGTMADERGILFVHVGPPVTAPTVAGTTAGAVSVLLPSLQRARELSKRTVSAANLRALGQACSIYAVEHEGQWPSELETLREGGYVEAKQLRSPLDEPGNISYVYIAGAQEKAEEDDDSRLVVAYEKSELYDYEGTNVLFSDGHVEFMRMDAFERVLERTYRRLGRESELPDSVGEAAEEPQEP